MGRDARRAVALQARVAVQRQAARDERGIRDFRRRDVARGSPHRIDRVLTPVPEPAASADRLPAGFEELDAVIARLTSVRERASESHNYVEVEWFTEQIESLRRVREAIVRRWANQPPESSPSGAGESDAGGGSDPGSGVTEEMEINRDTWPVYTDSTYQFAMAHPADFVVRPLDSAKLAELTPAPLASIRFMSPAIANSDLGDLDIPELNVRIFPAPPDGSLESWLAASGLTAEGDNVAAYQNAAVSGVQVCLSTLLAPNCSIFVIGNGWVYQLTPLGPVGQAMVDSFSLSS